MDRNPTDRVKTAILGLAASDGPRAAIRGDFTAARSVTFRLKRHGRPI